jgi:tight adherence protein C
MSALTPGQFGIALSLSCIAASAFLLVPLAQRHERARQRLLALRKAGNAQPAIAAAGPVPIGHRLVGGIGRMVIASGLLSRSTISDLEETIAASKNSGGHKLALFVGAKFVMFFGLPLLGWLAIGVVGLRISVPLVLVVLGVIGLLLPDMLVRRTRKKYLRAVDAGMPAALDLLIMCAEAGLSLEGGLERVSVEAEEAAPQTANEFRITANEMKILADRRQALVNIGTRTKLDSAVRLGGALAQSLKYGTPLIQALRVLAAEMRQVELTRFEERAARIPVLLTVPMIVFILPCIFVVVGGPAMVRVMQTFMHR